MGYYIQQLDTNFFLPVEHLDTLVQDAKALLTKEAKDSYGARGYTWRGEYITKHYSWVDEQGVLDGKTFAEIASGFRWSLEEDEEGNVTDFIFSGEKYGGDELVFLNTIAPYVKEGSFIEFRGEDGEQWKWYFNGNTCEEYFAEIIYSDLEGVK